MKPIKSYLIFITFLALVVYSAYLYSLRFDYVPWGSSKRDGLFFLTYYLIIIPLMLIVAILKRYRFRNKTSAVLRNSFFLYIIVISLPSLDTYGSQIALGFGVILCMIISLLVLFEMYKLDTGNVAT